MRRQALLCGMGGWEPLLAGRQKSEAIIQGQAGSRPGPLTMEDIFRGTLLRKVFLGQLLRRAFGWRPFPQE